MIIDFVLIIKITSINFFNLVFPSTIPKQLQILMGCFPIAQLREPYSSINYIAERIDLVKILKIKKSEDSYLDQGWSAM